MQSWLSRRLPICRRSILIASLNAMVLACLFPATSWAQSVNLVETFKNTIAPNWILGPTGQSGNPGAVLTAPNIDAAGDGWLRLTTMDNNRSGFAYYNTSFPAIRGVSISFDYAMWGGTGADGITVFLFDATTPTFQIGVNGGSLGYANGCGQNGAADYSTGLSGGYIGLAIDQYGNFTNTGDKCHNGGPGSRPNSIAIRGSAADKYNYLTSVQTTTTLATGANGVTASVGRASPNKVFVDIVPANGFYSITVRLQIGTGTASTIIDKYLTTRTPPNNLKLGFSAATGGATNYHEIRNVTITTPTDLQISTTNYPQTALAGNPVTYQIVAVNKGPNTDPAARISDPLPSQIANAKWTCAAAGGAQCSDPSGSGNIDQAVSLPVNGTVTYTITGTVAANTANNTTFQNTATIATSLPFTDINPSDNSTTVNTTTSTGKLIFLKRITGINGLVVNPSNNVPLNVFVDDTTSPYRDLDNDRGWPSNYLLGAINPGTVRNKDTIEYTVYFLNAGNVDLNNVKICDLITPNQTYVAGSMKLKLGNMASEISLTDANETTVDRGQFINSPSNAPTSCNLKSTSGSGVVVIDITGTGANIQPSLSVMPHSNATASQANTVTSSYGYIRFKTTVN
jgi:uncharacterized repeat protein (TIGR01451 family)